MPSTDSVESNLNNNSISDHFLWLGVPDLAVSSFETGSTSFKTDEEIQFKFTVTNEGTRNAIGTINNQLIINGEEIANFPFSDLDVGHMATIKFKVTFSEPGSKYMQIHVNMDGTISDSDYTNNIATTTISILPSDSMNVLP